MTLFLYGALSGILFLLPFALMGPRAMSATEVGLVLLPLGVIIGLFARPAGALADRIGVRAPLTAGSLLVAASGLALALDPPGLAGVLGPVLLLSAGMALVVAPLTTAVMNAAPDALAGAASGVSNAASRLAGLFAVALVGAVATLVFAAATGSEAAGARFGTWPEPVHPTVAAAFASAYGAGMAVCAGLAGLAALVAWLTLPSRRAIVENPVDIP
jgi:MFS family permease